MPRRPLLPHATCVLLAATALAASAAPPLADCSVRSGERLVPVVELFTSEGCSSCPPADQWLSRFKGRDAVVSAFHVSYWDYIGWVDRFASAANNRRQRELAAANRLPNVYTPQVLLNGRDLPDWSRSGLGAPQPARASVHLRRVAVDRYEAEVAPTGGASAAWSAYWTVTEDGHRSRVSAGENDGTTLRHDFVVRQYTPVGDYQGPARLSLYTVPPTGDAHLLRVNLVVHERGNGAPLQAASLSCS